jgi:hypothetical protein
MLTRSRRKEEEGESRSDCVSRKGTQEREVWEGRSIDSDDNGILSGWEEEEEGRSTGSFHIVVQSTPREEEGVRIIPSWRDPVSR